MTALIAAGAALLGIWIGQYLTARTERKHQEVDRRLRAGAAVLAAVPEMSRGLTNLAYLVGEDNKDRSQQVMLEYHASAIRWNAAVSQGLAFLLPHQTDQLLELDREVDRLLDEATSKGWDRIEFRSEREKLGELALALINDLRSSADLGPISAKSIWSWAENESASREGPSTDTGD